MATTITFTIPIGKHAEAVKALKAALPSMKNVEAAIASGSFKIPNGKAVFATDALTPFTTHMSVEITDDSVEEEVKKAEARLAQALEGLEARLNAKSNRMTAKLMNIAADLLDTL